MGAEVTESKLAAALAEFHKNLPDVGKGSVNPAFNSKYADLADIVKVVLPALGKQGLAWIATPRFTDIGFVLEYELRHTSGESVSGAWPLPDPTKTDQQKLGSAVTYAKRYTLCAVTGVAPDADDDGNASRTGSAASAPAKRAPAAAKRPSGQERVANASAALRAAPDREAFDTVWEQIRTSGLAGIADLVALHEELSAGFPPSAVDKWTPKTPAEGATPSASPSDAPSAGSELSQEEYEAQQAALFDTQGAEA